MIQFLLCIVIAWLIVNTITRGQPNDSTAGAAGIMAGLMHAVIAGVSFIAGGWWSAVGYIIFAGALAAWMQVRGTVPVDIERDLADYEAMKTELDAQREFAMKVLHQKQPKLP